MALQQVVYDSCSNNLSPKWSTNLKVYSNNFQRENILANEWSLFGAKTQAGSHLPKLRIYSIKAPFPENSN